MTETKLNKLMLLLDILDYDPATKTLTIDTDIKIKVKGNYKLETDKHIMIESNQSEMDEELNIPFSVFINSDELEQQMALNNAKKLL